MLYNIYRLLGDTIHLASVIFLILLIVFRKTCAGISGKTQILYLLIFLTRYADLLCFPNFYVTSFKIVYIILSSLTIYLIYKHQGKTYQAEFDTFRAEILCLLAFIFGFYINYEFTFIEICWAFSEYCEAVVMIPQFYMIYKKNWDMTNVRVYLLGMFSYKFLYVLNWIYRYYYEAHYVDLISDVCGGAYVLFFLTFFICYLCDNKKNVQDEDKYEKFVNECIIPGSGSISTIYDGDTNYSKNIKNFASDVKIGTMGNKFEKSQEHF